MGSTIEVILTIIGLSFWFLFPIGMFISVSKVDKNTDQIIRLEHLRQEETVPEKNVDTRPAFKPISFDWHHPVIYFRRWLQQ